MNTKRKTPAIAKASKASKQSSSLNTFLFQLIPDPQPFTTPKELL